MHDRLGTAPTITPTAALNQSSCYNSTYWAPTVSIWAEENVDAKLSSWALNLVPNPPTTILKGSFPTDLPPIFTGFGDPTEWINVIGVLGQLISIAKGGVSYASCELVEGPNDQCGPVTANDACESF